MRSADALDWILGSLRQGRLSTGLSVLGIAIGILAVTLLTAIGEGVRLYVLDSFSQFGSRLVAITPGRTQTQGLGSLLGSTRPLTLEDAEALRHLPGVSAVVPVVGGTGTIKAGHLSRASDIMGVGAEMPEAWLFPVASGQFLPKEDPGRPLAVLGSRMARELFPQGGALGQLLHIAGYRFRVVGTMVSKGQFLGFDLDDVVYIPADQALSLFNRVGLMEVDVVYQPYFPEDRLTGQLRQTLQARHGRDDVTLFTQSDMLATLDRILSVIKSAIAGLGGISLLVGGVGVFTILSIAVDDRQGEIGLLRALGCSQRLLLGLFLGEALLLSLLGGLVGMLLLLGIRGLLWLALPALPLELHLGYLLLSLGLAATVGGLAGALPAWRASRLSPVQALHAE
ncbi:ABC transporter permease [Gallaecimonas kandeliae]|uniref:ABC transporter permease n=1 Tax=Gallaecimonas kandeliae TaxID=3029055 RepID=UPI0026471261|nr:ABC transporter permease [Gallaecimonas kandeliae]WKE66857.1 ABC transporter permease [Gallaecimonas kandeliae]